MDLLSFFGVFAFMLFGAGLYVWLGARGKRSWLCLGLSLFPMLTAFPAFAAEPISGAIVYGLPDKWKAPAEDPPVFRILFTSLSMTEHYGPGTYEDFHPGAGLEVQASPSKDSPWSLAAGGHYMDRDSHGRSMWWAGITPSYTLGDRAGWWLEPGVTFGLIRKDGLYGDEPGPLALPRLAVGWWFMGVDLSYIPSGLNQGVGVGYAMLRLRFDL